MKICILGGVGAQADIWERSQDPEFVEFLNGFERYFDDPSMNAYFAAASEPKQVSWYPAGRDLNDPAAWKDRARWLQEHIGLRVK
jgi:hypothetical protein